MQKQELLNGFSDSSTFFSQFLDQGERQNNVAEVYIIDKL